MMKTAGEKIRKLAGKINPKFDKPKPKKVVYFHVKKINAQFMDKTRKSLDKMTKKNKPDALFIGIDLSSGGSLKEDLPV